MSPATTLQILAEGSTGRTVLVCHPEPADPDPEVTWARGITLLGADPSSDADDLAKALVGRGSEALVGRGSETLAGREAETLVQRAAETPTGRAVRTVGVVGWGIGGLTALALAAAHPALVDRLVVVATPADPPPALDLDRITAKSLLLYGANDPDAGPRDGKWFQQHLPNRRYEQNPVAGRLLLAPMWARVLSHLAPHNRRIS